MCLCTCVVVETWRCHVFVLQKKRAPRNTTGVSWGSATGGSRYRPYRSLTRYFCATYLGTPQSGGGERYASEQKFTWWFGHRGMRRTVMVAVLKSMSR